MMKFYKDLIGRVSSFANAIWESGQGLVEFLIIVAIVSAVMVGVISALGPSLKSDLPEVYCTIINNGSPNGDPGLTWGWASETNTCVEVSVN